MKIGDGMARNRYFGFKFCIYRKRRRRKQRKTKKKEKGTLIYKRIGIKKEPILTWFHCHPQQGRNLSILGTNGKEEDV